MSPDQLGLTNAHHQTGERLATIATKQANGQARRADLKRASTRRPDAQTGRRADQLLREVEDGTSAPSKTRDSIATAAELMFEHDGLSIRRG
jgi:hypothetical protein